MKKLAIKGNKKHNKDVIRFLEMLGGINDNHLLGDGENCLYFIDDNIIYVVNINDANLKLFHIHTLEDFPYKIGDNVLIYDYESPVKIVTMTWDGSEIKYGCFVDDNMETFTIDEIIPYEKNIVKEEIDEDKENPFEFFISFEKMIFKEIKNKWNEERPQDFIVCDAIGKDYDECNHSAYTWYMKVINGRLASNISSYISDSIKYKESKEEMIDRRIKLYESLMTCDNIVVWCIEHIQI